MDDLGWLCLFFGAVLAWLCIARRLMRHDGIGEAVVSAVAETLWLDRDGMLWLRREDDASETYKSTLLGEPRDELYDRVPHHLWGRLGYFIAEHEDAQRDAAEYRAGIEDTYRRSKL